MTDGSKKENSANTSKKKRWVIAFWITFVALLLVCAALGFTVLKLTNVNLFSKNISLDSTWILNSEDSNSNFYVYGDSYYVSNPNSFNEEQINVIENMASAYADVSRQANELNSAIIQYKTSVAGLKLAVPFVKQCENLPNGCEAVCASMLLGFNDFKLTPEQLVDDYLNCEPVKIRWGCRYGPDPAKAFAGDPRSKKGGWGCFSSVIVDALNKYLPEEYYAQNLTGITIDGLATKYLSRNIPVAVWVTQKMEPIEKAYQWQSYDKTETFLYPVNQHCMVLVGFDNESYFFLDPLSDGEVQSYDKNTAEKIFRSMGSQAVAVIKK